MTNAQPIGLSTVLESLTTAEQQARELAGGLSYTQVNWQPHEGRSWSVAQCLAHLARINRLYAAAMYEAVAGFRGSEISRAADISPGWFGAWFVRSMEPPPRRKMKAPPKSLPAQQSRSADAVAEFVESHQPVRGVIAAASHLDVNRVRFPNPFVPLLRFTVGTGLLIINAHDRRHLWQAGRVKVAPGFPSL